MEDLSFWGEKATESEPLMFRVPHDAILYVNQITLGGPCANTTSLWISSTASMGILSDDEDDEKESIETDSEDEENPLKSETLAVGHLTWGRQESSRTKLVFGGGEKLKFTVEGDGEVHIVGHLVIEDLSMFDEDEEDSEDEDDSDYEDEDGHAVVVAGDVDSDEGETIYEVVGESEEDSEDSDFDGVEDMVVEDGPLIEEIDSDEDSEEDSDSEDERLDAREVRRLLLGDDAGDRPDDEDDSDDEAEYEAALYAALAREDGEDEDGEGADEMHLVREEQRGSKKRARGGDFDEEFASPNGKKHKRQEHASGHHQHHRGGHKQHHHNNKQQHHHNKRRN